MVSNDQNLIVESRDVEANMNGRSGLELIPYTSEVCWERTVIGFLVLISHRIIDASQDDVINIHGTSVFHWIPLVLSE